MAEGIEGCRAEIPTLPPGLAASSRYIQFESDEAKPATIALQLTDESTDPAGLGYTTKIAGSVSDATLVSAQGFATGGCESGELVGDGDTGMLRFRGCPRQPGGATRRRPSLPD